MSGFVWLCVARSVGVSPAGSGSVSLPEVTWGETPLEPAGGTPALRFRLLFQHRPVIARGQRAGGVHDTEGRGGEPVGLEGCPVSEVARGLNDHGLAGRANEREAKEAVGHPSVEQDQRLEAG